MAEAFPAWRVGRRETWERLGGGVNWQGAGVASRLSFMEI